MNRESFMQGAIPAAMFIALEGLYAAPVIAGDGVIILQRDVPVRHAVREGAPGRVTSSIDVSPDDKVQQMVNGSRAGARSTELGDADFANISTGAPQITGMTADQSNLVGLTNDQLNSHGLSGSTTSGIAPMITGGVGGAVGGATSHINNGVAGVTGALSGLTGAIMRNSGQ